MSPAVLVGIAVVAGLLFGYGVAAGTPGLWLPALVLFALILYVRRRSPR